MLLALAAENPGIVFDQFLCQVFNLDCRQDRLFDKILAEFSMHGPLVQDQRLDLTGGEKTEPNCPFTKTGIGASLLRYRQRILFFQPTESDGQFTEHRSLLPLPDQGVD